MINDFPVASPTTSILYLFVDESYSLLLVLLGSFMLCDYRVVSGIEWIYDG